MKIKKEYINFATLKLNRVFHINKQSLSLGLKQPKEKLCCKVNIIRIRNNRYLIEAEEEEEEELQRNLSIKRGTIKQTCQKAEKHKSTN